MKCPAPGRRKFWCAEKVVIRLGNAVIALPDPQVSNLACAPSDSLADDDSNSDSLM
jgi:hypothetical protein